MKNSVKDALVDELHAPARVNYPRRQVVLKSKDNMWEADLVDMQAYARTNKNYRYILTIVDAFSKFAFARAVKKKTGEEVSLKFADVLKKSKRTPKLLHTDKGSEFFNSVFQALLSKHNIRHYHTFSGKKASMVERFNRTLKGLMFPEFHKQGNYKWLALLPRLVRKYNNRKHRTIGMKPSEVNDASVERRLLNSVYRRPLNLKPPKFKVGDFVRVSKVKGIFDKKYTSNWTTEVFKIRKVQLTDPRTYLLVDEKEEPIAGGFYEQELKKTKYTDSFLVEKILKRKKGQVYVKWLGMNEKTWIPEKNLIK